jgi:hypothetical protein
VKISLRNEGIKTSLNEVRLRGHFTRKATLKKWLTKFTNWKEDDKRNLQKSERNKEQWKE